MGYLKKGHLSADGGKMKGAGKRSPDWGKVPAKGNKGVGTKKVDRGLD